MKIKILKDDEKSFFVPKRGTSKSAAYDLYVQEDVIIKKGRQVIPMGFALSLDTHTAAEIHPRSGYASKGMEGYEIMAAKSYDKEKTEWHDGVRYAALEPSHFDADVVYGLVDEDYTNEIGVIVNNRDNEFLIKRGTRIAQLLIIPTFYDEIEYVETLPETDRKGGFGSTNSNN